MLQPMVYEPISQQVQSIANYLKRVWHYDQASDYWFSYDPQDPAGSDLNTLINGVNYWVQVSGFCTLIYTSPDGDSYNYSFPAISPNWNYLIWGQGITDPPTEDTPISGISAILPSLMVMMMMGAMMKVMQEIK